MTATAKAPNDIDEMIDTGRPWPFKVSLDVHPFEQRLTINVTTDADGLTPDEADTLMTTIEVARDVAREYAARPTPWD